MRRPAAGTSFPPPFELDPPHFVDLARFHHPSSVPADMFLGSHVPSISLDCKVCCTERATASDHLGLYRRFTHRGVSRAAQPTGGALSCYCLANAVCLLVIVAAVAAQMSGTEKVWLGTEGAYLGIIVLPRIICFLTK